MFALTSLSLGVFSIHSVTQLRIYLRFVSRLCRESPGNRFKSTDFQVWDKPKTERTNRKDKALRGSRSENLYRSIYWPEIWEFKDTTASFFFVQYEQWVSIEEEIFIFLDKRNLSKRNKSIYIKCNKMKMFPFTSRHVIYLM